VTGEEGDGRGSTAGEIPWRFSAESSVLRRGSGGEAWAGVGGHGGGVNLTGGGLRWPVHGGWRAFAAVKSPARPSGAIGDEQVCTRLVTERQTLRARPI
jgi:hypothetical protein